MTYKEFILHSYAKASLLLTGLFVFISMLYSGQSIIVHVVFANALFSILVIFAGNALWGAPGIFFPIPPIANVKLIFANSDPLKPWEFLPGDISGMVKNKPARLKRVKKIQNSMSKVKAEVNQTPLVVSEHMGNGTLNAPVIPADFNRGKLYKANRSGNYSGRGYRHMDGPLTEAERWDMPFVNPVFEYESYTEA